jgi:hypothetical protein
MRKGTALTFVLLFAALLLVHRIPEAFGVACTMSGQDRVPVDMGLGDTTYFTADWDPGTNVLHIMANGGIAPSCTPPPWSLDYLLTKNEADTKIDITRDREFAATWRRNAGAAGFSNVEGFDSRSGNFYAHLVGNRVEVFSGGVLFDTPLVPYPPGEVQFVRITNPIAFLNHSPIPGPGFCVTVGPNCTCQVANAIDIPIAQDPQTQTWYLDLRCGDQTFGPILSGVAPVVPALSGSGLLFFCVALFGVGIWAMRKARFGDTMAGP